MSKRKEYKVIKKRSASFRAFSGFIRFFARKPQIINLSGEELPQKAIYIMNHCGASGPFSFELFFPVKCTPMGAHEMCGSYRERWHYLYHTFYRQKLHWGRLKSFTVATFFGLISKSVYNAVGLIGTYTDGRVLSSFRKGFSVLDQEMGLLIFPEDSEKGYFDKPLAFHRGFVHLAKLYHKKSCCDVPVYNVYYSRKCRKIIVDKPISVVELLKEGYTEQQIADLFLENCHRMYDTYCAPAVGASTVTQKQG